MPLIVSKGDFLDIKKTAMEVQRPGTNLSLSRLCSWLTKVWVCLVSGVSVWCASRSRRTVPDFNLVCGGEEEEKGGITTFSGGKRFLGLFGSRARSGFMIKLKSDRVMGPLTDPRSQISPHVLLGLFQECGFERSIHVGKVEVKGELPKRGTSCDL